MVKSELNTLFPKFFVPCYNTNVLNILLKPIDLEAYEYDVKLLRLTFALLLIFRAISRRFFVVFWVNTPRHWNEVNNGTLYLALVFSTFQFEWWGRGAKNSTWPQCKMVQVYDWRNRTTDIISFDIYKYLLLMFITLTHCCLLPEPLNLKHCNIPLNDMLWIASRIEVCNDLWV